MRGPEKAHSKAVAFSGFPDASVTRLSLTAFHSSLPVWLNSCPRSELTRLLYDPKGKKRI